ncbi:MULTISPECIES: transcription termination/antitermination protein NusG [unclassified Sulfitobacter]|uniref:transcription termination/antitermination protein NusG n=1 Tax=unclassified Sulfitobacter TaxID=196795 RepID=UPI0037462DC6
MSDKNRSGWFVAQLRPHGLSQARVHLKRQGFETYSPLLMESSRSRPGKGSLERPLFPGYLFVNFDPNQTGWTAINSTRGVSRLILNDLRRPRPLPEGLIRALQNRCDPEEAYQGENDLEVGDRVRVLTGPFAELVTKIEALPSAGRVGVLIDLMGREVRSSLPRGHVAKVEK